MDPNETNINKLAVFIIINCPWLNARFGRILLPCITLQNPTVQLSSKTRVVLNYQSVVVRNLENSYDGQLSLQKLTDAALV